MQLRKVARDSPRPGPWGPIGKRLKQFGLCHLGKMQRGLSPVRKKGENSTLDNWRQSDQKKKKDSRAGSSWFRGAEQAWKEG